MPALPVNPQRHLMLAKWLTRRPSKRVVARCSRSFCCRARKSICCEFSRSIELRATSGGIDLGVPEVPKVYLRRLELKREFLEARRSPLVAKNKTAGLTGSSGRRRLAQYSRLKTRYV